MHMPVWTRKHVRIRCKKMPLGSVLRVGVIDHRRAMITVHTLRDRLAERPFRPFRVALTDGSQYEVPHPEFGWVFGGRAFIGVPGPGQAWNDFDASVKEIAVLHITRIESLPRRAADA